MADSILKKYIGAKMLPEVIEVADRIGREKQWSRAKVIEQAILYYGAGGKDEQQKQEPVA